MFFDNYNTLKLLDEKICDAKLIQLVVISTFFYIRNTQGNEMYSSDKYANTMSDFIYGSQSSNLKISQLGKLAIYSKGKLI